MKACIHRGSHEIGGTCVELESQGARIILDIGLPLNAKDDPTLLPHVNGFAHADPSLLGVVISHPHLDHYGLAHHLPRGTRFLIGPAAQRMLAAATLFSPGGVHLEPCTPLEDGQPIKLGPFTITPHLMDHSAYDAYAVLVEADGRSLFFTGDFRAHGRKSQLFQKLLRLPSQAVDVLLMEGTTIGRADTANGVATEQELEARLADIFQQTAGMALVWCSGQNMDRLVSVFKATMRAKRNFIIDRYTATILRSTKNVHLPQADWAKVRVFLPKSQKQQIINAKAFDLAKSYRNKRIYPDKLATEAPHSVMLFRPSMREDLDSADCLAGARMVYSMWSGYLKNEKQKQFFDWLGQHHIPMVECHTSGHATVADLQRLRRHFADAPVVPIHTQYPGRFKELFENVQERKDGEPWEV